MAAFDVLPWLPGGALLTTSMVLFSEARLCRDAYRIRMSLYLAFFGLILLLVTSSPYDFSRVEYFGLFCIGLGAFLGYLRGKLLSQRDVVSGS